MNDPANTIREFHADAMVEAEQADADVARASAALRSSLDRVDEAIENQLGIAGSVSGRPHIVGDAGDLADAIRRREYADRRVVEFDSLARRAGVSLNVESIVDGCEVCGDGVREGDRHTSGPHAGRIFCEEHDPETSIDRPHRFSEGDHLRHADSDEILAVLETTWRERDGVRYPTYTLTNESGDDIVDDVLDTADLRSA